MPHQVLIVEGSSYGIVNIIVGISEKGILHEGRKIFRDFDRRKDLGSKADDPVQIFPANKCSGLHLKCEYFQIPFNQGGPRPQTFWVVVGVPATQRYQTLLTLVVKKNGVINFTQGFFQELHGC